MPRQSEALAERGADYWPRDEKDRAFTVWAVEAGKNLKKTSEITGVPYVTVWRWCKADDWEGRWRSEWGELTGPARATAASIVAMQVDGIMSQVIADATNPNSPLRMVAAKLALEWLNDPQSIAGMVDSAKNVYLTQFNGMSEEQMRKAIGAMMQENMSGHQVERTRKASK